MPQLPCGKCFSGLWVRLHVQSVLMSWLYCSFLLKKNSLQPQNLKSSIWIWSENFFLSSCERHVCVKLKNDWFLGAIIFYPAGWGRMVVIYFVQLFWCFSISCVDLFTGKAAILEIETKSYNAESGELLCMNRWVLPETSHSNVVMSYAFYWKNEEKGPAILLTREG